MRQWKKLHRSTKVVAWTTGTIVVVAVPIALSVIYAGYEFANAEEGRISQSHRAYSIWVQSLTNLITQKIGQSSMKRFEISCQNAAKTNEQLLLQILSHNTNTIYGIERNFDSITCREEYREHHPLTNHSDYQTYIQRMEMGEANVLFHDPIKMFGVTSGTSGSHKLVPVVKRQRKLFFTEGIGVVFDTMVRGVNSNGVTWPNLQKSCKLMYTPEYTQTKNGVRIGPNSSAPGDNTALLELYSTDRDAWAIQDDRQLLRLHCFYALLDRNLGIIESNFASGVFNFFECIDLYWDELVTAIETGTLPESLVFADNTLKNKLEAKLRPNPQRAAELTKIRTTTSNHAFARQAWPYLHTIMANETGSFGIYGTKLRMEWIGDEIPIYSPIYAATEGLLGVNPDYSGKAFVLHPLALFFEFIPIEETNQESPSTIFLEQLEPGNCYEVIITNLAGLYRYRLGDVIQCIGYQGESPLVKMAYRKGQFLNAMQEQTSEQAFYEALTSTVTDKWKMKLGEYTTVEYFLHSRDRRPRYTVYVELYNAHDNAPITRKLSSHEMDQLDQQLCQINPAYGKFRSKGRMHRIDVFVVQSGTFREMRHTMVQELGCNPSQLKQPRVTRHERLISLLEQKMY